MHTDAADTLSACRELHTVLSKMPEDDEAMATCLQTAADPRSSAVEQGGIPCDTFGNQRRRNPLTVTRMWAQVAEARSDETFVALCLLTVTGASLLTQKLGFSDTMGAFVAGVLLAETNYSTQVQPLCIRRRRIFISNTVACMQPAPRLLACS